MASEGTSSILALRATSESYMGRERIVGRHLVIVRVPRWALPPRDGERLCLHNAHAAHGNGQAAGEREHGLCENFCSFQIP